MKATNVSGHQMIDPLPGMTAFATIESGTVQYSHVVL